MVLSALLHYNTELFLKGPEPFIYKVVIHVQGKKIDAVHYYIN